MAAIGVNFDPKLNLGGYGGLDLTSKSCIDYIEKLNTSSAGDHITSSYDNCDSDDIIEPYSPMYRWEDMDTINQPGYAEYCEKLKTSGGFDVDEVKDFVGVIVPVDLEERPVLHGTAFDFAKTGIQMYNNHNDTNYKAEKIVKVNLEPRYILHITFEAVDDAGCAKTLQTVGSKFIPDNDEESGEVVRFCQVKGTPRDYDTSDDEDDC